MLEISLNSSLYIFCSKPDRRRVFYTNISAVTVVEASQRLHGHGSSVVETPPWEACVDEVIEDQILIFDLELLEMTGVDLINISPRERVDCSYISIAGEDSLAVLRHRTIEDYKEKQKFCQPPPFLCGFFLAGKKVYLKVTITDFICLLTH